MQWLPWLFAGISLVCVVAAIVLMWRDYQAIDDFWCGYDD